MAIYRITTKILPIAFLACAIGLSGCTPFSTTPEGGTATLSDLQRLGTTTARKIRLKRISDMRYAAIKDTALSIGARSGLAWRARQIDKELSADAQNLRSTYNFYGMLMDNDVLPPVLAEAQHTLNLASPESIRLSSKIYKIVAQARFVTAPPTWRDYLWMDYPPPDSPNASLLPRNSREEDVWKFYVAIGWKNGIEQANHIFAENLNRLNRDYKGMALYRKLYAQNMVSAPFVAQTNLGITGDSQHMRIDDRVLRITALPQLNLRGNTWKPVIVPTNPTTKLTMHIHGEHAKNVQVRQHLMKTPVSPREPKGQVHISK